MNEPKRRTFGRFLFKGITALLALVGLATVLTWLFVFHIFSPSLKVDPSAKPIQFVRTDVKTSSPQELYLELMKTMLTRYGLEGDVKPLINPEGRLAKFIPLLFGSSPLFRLVPFDSKAREEGRDHPLSAETMIGLKRLDNLQALTTEVILRKVPGDFIECGAWRGGACIFMRSILKAYGDVERKVWVADSFEGLPNPNRAIDIQYFKGMGGEIAGALEDTKRNFARYGLLDDQVVFLKGWFINSLPKAPIGQLAILRVDCDLYDSVTQSLQFF
jgi:O-methyltransferase